MMYLLSCSHMKQLFGMLLLAVVCTAPCAAQRHPYNSHPYHPPAPPQRTQRDVRRVAVVKPAPQPNAPQPAKRSK